MPATHSNSAQHSVNPRAWLTAGLIFSLAILPGGTSGRSGGSVGAALATSATPVLPVSVPAAFDLRHAYEAGTPYLGEACTPLVGPLGGMTLVPGIYCFDADAALTGTLTLDGPVDGIWSFQVGRSGSGALVATNTQVVLTGGAEPCHVIWWVADQATMTSSEFHGTVLAGGAITLIGGSFVGNTWSKAEVIIRGTAVTPCGETRSAEQELGPSCTDGDRDTRDGCADRWVGRLLGALNHETAGIIG